MAFGFTPHHSEDLALDGLTAPQFLALCVTTARSLDWDIRYVSDAGLIALTKKQLLKVKERVTIRIAQDIAHLRSESTGGAMVDWGRNKRNIELFTQQLTAARTSYSPEQLAQTYEEIKPDLVPPDHDFLSEAGAAVAKGGSFLSLFVPREGYLITPILVDLNLAVFLIMAFSGVSIIRPTIPSLIHWGANMRALTLDGEWWRIITNTFVHIGFLHVAFNMYALLYIGVLLERQLGSGRFLIAYLLTGVMASVASLYWHANTVSAGASGAIFGMYGVFLALLTTNLIEKSQRKPLLTSIMIFVGYNLLYGTKSGVDNAAHVGGLVSGLVIGYLYYPGLRNPANPRLRNSGLIAAALLVGVVTVSAFKSIPNDYPIFQRKMEAFARLEKQALGVLQAPTNEVSPATWANAIRDTGIRNWNSSIRILNQARQLDVTKPLKATTDQLIRYCHWRILSYNYLRRRLTDSTAVRGEDSTTYYDSQIKAVIDSLNSDK